MNQLRIIALSVMILWLLAACQSSSVSDEATATTRPIVAVDGNAEINGTSLYYKQLGEGDPIIFLHGSGGSHRYFLPYVEPLAATHQLIFYDRRGTGLSDGDLDMAAVSIEQFVEDLESLRLHLELEKITLIGHSWGAAVSLAYADRYGENVSHLILVNSIPINNSFHLEFSETLQERIAAFTSEEQEMWSTECTNRLDELDEEAIKQCSMLNAKIRFYDPSKALAFDATVDESTSKNRSIVRSLLSTDFTRTQRALEENLSTLNMPSLVIHGDYDPIPIASSEYLANQLPNSQFVILENCGHFPFAELPTQFADEINSFLISGTGR